VIQIRPEVAMYAAFARLNYRHWYALGEFVDNSLQSAISNLARLRKQDGDNYRLLVTIDISEDGIEIRDNAAGIPQREYARAFLPASPPADTSGLSEFGLGMKAAASWYAHTWSVRTSALGENVERTITFDIPTIVATNCQQLVPVESPAKKGDHYTTLVLRNLQQRPQGRTLKKIADHLQSIYRVFLRDGLLELKFRGESLAYDPPKFLNAPRHAAPTSKPVLWRKNIELDMGDGHRVRGWAGILARASVTNAGFAVFRRRRLIQGSHGEAYRPEKIFGKPNKFVYQRLVGELEVEGFSVSHTKDGIQWEDWEEDILTWLKDKLDEPPLRLLDQAKNFRVRESASRDHAADATRDTSQVIAQHLPPIIDEQLEAEPDESPLEEKLAPTEDKTPRAERVELQLEHAHRRWNVTVEINSDPAREAWYELAESGTDITDVHIRVNLAHPFMVRFVGPDGDEIIPFTRLAAGLAIAEITAREAGGRAGTMRHNLNQILRSALSGPIQEGESQDG
jgi:hypothetical protein